MEASIADENIIMLFTVHAARATGSPSRKKRAVKLRCLLDSGSTHSFMTSKYNACVQPNGAQGQVHMANGSVQKAVMGVADLTFAGCHFEQTVGIMPLGSAFDVILGQDWLDRFSAILHYDKNDPDLVGKDERGVQFKMPGTQKMHWCPIPLHLRQATLNSVVRNTAAALRHAHADPDAHSEVSHAFMVYVSHALPEQDYMPAYAAAAHDSTLPHHIEAMPPAEDNPLHVENESMVKDITELVANYSDRFPAEMPAGLPPVRPEVAHPIPLKDPNLQPPYRKFYRLTQQEKVEVERQLASLLEKEWIQPSHSPYGAPILFTAKKDGGLRMCVDYRALNKQTVKNRYPLPRIDDLLDSLHGARYFSALDLQQAYHQVRLDTEDIPKSAFITHKGQFEYRVMSFGLSNAPATFQALMNRVLSPYLGKFCCVYLDDILVYSQTPDDHLAHLRLVLDAFREHTLYCKLSKCRFAMAQVPFLGHIVTREGVKPNPAKIQVLLDWPAPENTKDLKCFLGLAQYLAKFIPGYAVTAAPLQALLRKHAKWDWSDMCASAFQEIKERMTTSPVLALPDMELPFEVVTDACQTGVGAVLLQKGKPVAFAGRLLTPPETRYSTTDQELLAVMYAVTTWRCYLQGAKHDFLLVTDHHPNTYFSTQPSLSRRQARWSEKLQDYNFQWEYRPGRHNIADPVSRSPGLQQAVVAALQNLSFDWQERPDVLHTGLAAAMVTHTSAFQQLMLQSAAVTRSQAKDISPDAQRDSAGLDDPLQHKPAAYGQHETDRLSILSELKDAYLQDPMYGDPDDVTMRHKHMSRRNGLWYKNGVIAVPNSPQLRREILSELHESGYAGHGGEYKTVQLVRRYFWWPALDNDCRTFVKGCAQCQRNKASTRKYTGLLQQHELATQKWDQVSMDFITHLPCTIRQHDQILVVVDTFTKMAHFIPCKMSDTAEDVAGLYVREVFKLHGWPKVLITDRDSKFTDGFFRALCKQLGTRQAMSTARHPETDGQTERMNRVLEETLRHYINDKMDNWDVLLPAAEFSVNNAFQQSIQTTPFHLNYGYHPRVPIDVGVCPQPTADALLQDVHSTVLNVGRFFAFAQQQLHADHIAALVSVARDTLAAARNKQAQYANAKRTHCEFGKGDKVMLKTSTLALLHWPSRKLFPRWIGPFEVDKRIGPVAYKLVLPAFWRLHDVFHVNVLKPYRDNGQDHPPSPFTVIAGRDNEYEVEGILDHKPKDVVIRKGLPNKVLKRLQFRVRWMYSGPEHDSWEPYENMKNAPESLTAYGL